MQHSIRTSVNLSYGFCIAQSYRIARRQLGRRGILAGHIILCRKYTSKCEVSRRPKNAGLKFVINLYRIADFVCKVLICANYASCHGFQILILQLLLHFRFNSLHVSQFCAWDYFILCLCSNTSKEWTFLLCCLTQKAKGLWYLYALR